MRRVLVYGASLVCLGLALSACQKEGEAKQPDVVRPVLSTVVKSQTLQVRGFAGKIEPRFETQLGFRTLGRIVRRDVSVGDQVS
ncbi:efflux RND transporter periplasmic adaptor subunit, partial [Escherichia coli]|nr:efflux RND transporter periplasmic adaptor subunit [Escherichia coli]